MRKNFSGLLTPLLSLLVAAPLCAQIGGPLKGIQLRQSKIALQPVEKQQLETLTHGLLMQHFAGPIGLSSAVHPQILVTGRIGKKLSAEALVVFLAKNTYTATVAKLEYDIEDGKATLRNKIDNFTPAAGVLRKTAAASPAVMQLKASLLQNLKLSLPQGHGPKAMANTANPEFPSAVQATNDVGNIFTQAFGSVDKKIGAASTKAAVMNVLQTSTNLLAWNNIGHGNPGVIIQWNSEPMWSSDFSSATNFSGLYHAVVLLNSCNVCASPFSLKNAIMSHNPRAYIGGIISLPVARSEFVDVDFWRATLINSQPMGIALNTASAAHGLTGAFCLEGFNGRFVDVATSKLTEDCNPLNYNNVTAAFAGGAWKVVDGGSWLLDFGSNQANAQKARDIIKHYKMDKQCFVGRPHAPMTYFTVAGSAPTGAYPGEDATTFNPANVTASLVSGAWKVVDGSHWLLDFGTKEAEAKNAVRIIKFYGFTHMCFVGRPNPGMTYFPQMMQGRLVIQRSLQLILTALLALASEPGLGGEPLYIIERSTLQTRNFTPIVNHAVLLMNLGERPLVMDVNSAVPPGKWQKGPFWPAFLAESQLPDPMFSPLDISPKKTTYLPKPQILEQGTSAAFLWKDVQLAPGEAAIGQYDNWYGEAGVFWSDTGLTLPGLRIRTTYSADSKGDSLNLGFFYEVENLATAAFEDLTFEVFVPLTVLTDAAEIKLLEATEIATSPNLTTSLTTRSDGLGRAASGVAAVLFGGTLESRGKVKLHLKVSGRRTADKGTLWPLLSLRGRSLAGGETWPQAEVKLAEPAEVGRFSYLAYNLVLPDSRAVSLGSRSAKVLRAAEAKKLGP